MNKPVNESQMLKTIHGIYLNTIAQQIKDEAEIKEGEFRKPLDTPAYRIANEIVANYLTSNLMAGSMQIISRETDNYVRQRHDANWANQRLMLPEGDIIEELILACASNSPSARSSAASQNRRIKPKSQAGDTTEDVAPSSLQVKTQDLQFVESQDFSQLTGILTTGVGAEYTQNVEPVPSQTGLTFTVLNTDTTVESTYDPRGVKAKPKPLPKISKADLANSNFKASDFTTTGEGCIDTILNKEDYEEHKRQRNELKKAGIINRDVTITQTFQDQTQTTDSYLKPRPRNDNPQTTIDSTWAELEEMPDDPTLLIGQCPFAKDFKEIVERKKKLVSMGIQTTKPNIASAPKLPPISPLPPEE
jgi:hypothetical protein